MPEIKEKIHPKPLGWIATKSNKERFILFCDAIFAIAITLLILQIDVPEIVHENNINNVLWELRPRFVSFGISFFVIARFWLVHLNLFAHVRRLDMKLVTFNMIFMALVVFLPFTTDFYGAHSSNKYVLAMYVLSIAATSLMSLVMWRYLFFHRDLLIEDHDMRELRRHSWRGLMIPLEFFSALIIVFIFPSLVDWYWIIFLGIVGIVLIGNRLISHKEKSAEVEI